MEAGQKDRMARVGAVGAVVRLEKEVEKQEAARARAWAAVVKTVVKVMAAMQAAGILGV